MTVSAVMFEQKLEKIAKILLYAAPFLTLIFIEGLYYPFMITKTVFFRLLMQLGLSLYLLLLALDFKKYKPRLNAGFILVGAFFLVNLAAAIFGYDFYKSFWSGFERMEGLISLVYLMIYLFLLVMFLKEKPDWLFYIRLILISSVLVSLYGLGQKFNLLPVFQAGISRIPSTVGNAAFLAGYLLLAIGLGAYYYFNEAKKNYKYFALASIGLNFIVLLLTSTRGAILGLVIGLMFFILLNAIFLSGKTRKIYIIILLIIAALISVFFIFKGRLANSNIEFVNRLATISLNDASVKNRVTVWKMALKDFKFHSVLGIGMENFEVVYNKYFQPDINENWFDRTHNVYLDQLMNAGILGLLAYLMILFYLFYLLFKKRHGDYYEFAILSSLLIAYSIHNFFVFDTINTSFLYFFLIGLIGFKAVDAEAGEQPGQPNNRAFNRVFIVLLFVNIFVFYKLVYLPLKINRAVYVGYYYVLADTFRSYENFKYALGHKFSGVESAAQLNKMNDVVSAQSNIGAAVKEQYSALTREKLKFASDNYPFDIKTKIYLGQFILNYYKDNSELDEAESLLKRSIELSPSRVEPHYLLFNLYSKRGDRVKALSVLDELMNRLPWFGGVKIMLMAEIYKEDPERAEELYQAGIKQFGYGDFGGLIKILNYLIAQKRYNETVPFYEELVRQESKRYDYRLDLAQIYYLTKNLDAAIEQVNLISQESPETLKGSEGFVNSLRAEYEKK